MGSKVDGHHAFGNETLPESAMTMKYPEYGMGGNWEVMDGNEAIDRQLIHDEKKMSKHPAKSRY